MYEIRSRIAHKLILLSPFYFESRIMCLEVFPNISFPILADSGKLGATEFINPVPPDFP
jgi:hypothetical protein